MYIFTSWSTSNDCQIVGLGGESIDKIISEHFNNYTLQMITKGKINKLKVIYAIKFYQDKDSQ